MITSKASNHIMVGMPSSSGMAPIPQLQQVEITRRSAGQGEVYPSFHEHRTIPLVRKLPHTAVMVGVLGGV